MLGFVLLFTLLCHSGGRAAGIRHSRQAGCVTKDEVQFMLQAERQLLVHQLDHHVGSVKHPASSCKSLPENYLAGYYWIQNSTGDINHMYCDTNDKIFNTHNNSSHSRGWMRVAHVDMTNSRHQCPSGFREKFSPKRTCVKMSDSSGCASVSFETYGQEYKQVCGRIKAYQHSHPSAFKPYILRRTVTLNETYVDGVSLTHGRPIRHHIWTFAASYSADEINNQCSCSAQPDSNIVPSFVGGDFFCDTASKTGYEEITFKDNPLWDGQGCDSQTTCCSFNNPPWFCKQLPQSTTDDIEMRLCLNYPTDFGNILIEQIEIFVQ